MEKNKRIWRLCIVSVIIIIIVTFSPLVITPGKIQPFLFGLPYTLWIGILLTIALVIITLIAGNVLPNDEEVEK
jgi:uncharacterized membrane protein YkgB